LTANAQTPVHCPRHRAGPEVLLLDEPCSALDPVSTELIEDLIDDLAKHYGIVIVTHNISSAIATLSATNPSGVARAISGEGDTLLIHAIVDSLTRRDPRICIAGVETRGKHGALFGLVIGLAGSAEWRVPIVPVQRQGEQALA
jgi:hypothetical protein